MRSCIGHHLGADPGEKRHPKYHVGSATVLCPHLVSWLGKLLLQLFENCGSGQSMHGDGFATSLETRGSEVPFNPNPSPHHMSPSCSSSQRARPTWPGW